MCICVWACACVYGRVHVCMGVCLCMGVWVRVCICVRTDEGGVLYVHVWGAAFNVCEHASLCTYPCVRACM